MAVLYIREQGTTVTKNSGCIKIIKGSRTILERPVISISSIAVFGNVQVSAQAVRMLLEKGIDLEYFSYSGKYIGRLAADSSKNIFLRMQQYDLYMNEEKRFEIARNIIRNKIENQIRIIETHRWDNSYDWREDIKQMRLLESRLDQKVTSSSIMGIEGAVSNIYFRSYGQMFSCDFQFEKRSRRPPRNPINVILSLAYTLLTKEVAGSLEAESFEMYMGFLHGIRYGRKSLALDIVEEFRQPIADRLVLKIFNKRMLTKEDFETDDDRVVLTENGFRTFCTAYERWIGGLDSTSGEKNFRKVIRAQTAFLKKAIREEKMYIPYAWKH